MLVLSSLVCLAVVHTGFVVLCRMGKFKARSPSLTRALGMFFMDFLISLVAIFLAPFQCLPSRNGGWALRPYPMVVRWSLAGQQVMVAGGRFALVLPMSFLSQGFLVARQWDRHMLKGDAVYLDTYEPAFFRFRTEYHWFTIICRLRSAILSCSFTTVGAPLWV